MAIRNIVKNGDDTLKKVCRTQLTFDERLASLFDDMADTMYAADGCGLAASQVGILRRVCIVDVGDGLLELVNPVIIETEGKQEEQEGCLSFPGEYGTTVRPMKVKVRAQDRFGNTFTAEGEGLKARAFCHEIDHLDGIVFKNRLK
ncbi:MAG: peptide deformylase [Clostridia bacterium]|nr:peptide deformylase [Clostridia bacterium]